MEVNGIDMTSIEDIDVSEENRLIQAVQRGGEEAEEARQKIMLLSWPIVERVSKNYRRFIPVNEREDFTQNLFLEIPALIEKHDPEIGRFAGQLITRLDGAGKDTKKPSKKELVILDDPQDRDSSPKDMIIDPSQNVEESVIETLSGDNIDIFKALSTLTDKELDVIGMLYRNDHDTTLLEVSKVLGITEAGVSKRHATALEKLRAFAGDPDKKTKSKTTSMRRKEILSAPTAPAPKLQQKSELPTNFSKISKMKRANLTEINTLKHLHLVGRQSSKILGVSSTTYNQKVNALKAKYRVNTKAELALLALDQGIEFDVPAPDKNIVFTEQEKIVASNITLDTLEISEKLGMTYEDTRKNIESLLEKTGAENVTTIALIEKMHGLS